MSSQEERPNIEFTFECEACSESWSENLLDLVDRLTRPEILILIEHLTKKLEE